MTQRDSVVTHRRAALTFGRRVTLDQTGFIGTSVADAHTVDIGVVGCGVAGDVGNGVADLGDVLVGSIQLRTVHCVGAGSRKVTCRHVGDSGSGAGRVQGHTVVVDAAIGIDVVLHGPLIQVLNSAVGSEQLRTIDSVSAGAGQTTCRDVGDSPLATYRAYADGAGRSRASEAVVGASDGRTTGANRCGGY
ncbi:hypothetical protein D3C77_451080 [compost metagenome]